MSCEANDACFRIQKNGVSGFSHALRGPYRLSPTVNGNRHTASIL